MTTLKEYQETLNDYHKWIDKEIELNDTWDDDVFYIVTVRDDLHNIVSSLQSQITDLDFQSLKSADKKWQEWLLGHTEEGFVMVVNREGVPKNKWWWWIDKLSELSQEERATI